jgi:hypothetical protein
MNVRFMFVSYSKPFPTYVCEVRALLYLIRTLCGSNELRQIAAHYILQ